MGDGDKRQLVTIAIVTAVVGGGYLAFDYFMRSPEAAPEAPADGTTDASEPSTPAEADDADEDAEPEPGATPTSPAQRLARQRLFTLETDHFLARISSLNTGLVSLTVKGDRYVDETGPHEMVSTDREEYFPLKVEIGGVPIPDDAVWEGEQLSPTAVRFRWSGAGFTVVRKLEAGSGPYQIWSTLRVENTGRAARPVRPKLTTHAYVVRDEEGGGFLARPSPATSRGVCLYGESELAREDRDALSGGQGYGPDAHFVGIESSYFATVLATDEPAERCQMSTSNRGGTIDEPHGTLFEARLVYPRVSLEGGAGQTWRTLAYVGPKDLDAIDVAGHQLREVVDFGWFDFIAEGLVTLLRWIYGFAGNWGLAIILLTFLVKLCLYPLTEKSFQSMAKMRRLKPEMDKLTEKYGDDREKKTAAMMELYRKEKINPLGGCLPTMLQMPVWFALYQSLSTNVELYHAPFALWWIDLSAPDPYYVLPVVLGGLMFLQQRLTPTTMDPMQAKMMMYFMPLMITGFMLFLPSGLCLYMVTNSTLGLGQQRWIHYRLDREAEDQKSLAAAQAASAAAESAERDESDEPDRPKGKARSAPSSKKQRARRRKSRGRA